MFERYSGSTAHLVTKHSKASVIAPVFAQKLGIDVLTVTADTDLLGTFSGEVLRKKSQLETAIDKALIAKDLSAAKICIASEGTIGPDPSIPVLMADIETIVFIDLEADLVIQHTYLSRDIYSFRTKLTSTEQLKTTDLQLEKQAMIVRSSEENSEFIQKGLQNISDLRGAVESALSLSEAAIIEPDYRAMYSESRRLNIMECARLLAEKISSCCPSCLRPGWSSVPSSVSKTCADCGGKNTSVPRGRIYRCEGCEYQVEELDASGICEPRFCFVCNA